MATLAFTGTGVCPPGHWEGLCCSFLPPSFPRSGMRPLYLIYRTRKRDDISSHGECWVINGWARGWKVMHSFLQGCFMALPYIMGSFGKLHGWRIQQKSDAVN
ncbi:hypothetical protein AVEN_173208-1 [Araneus ventricosus]|uniref:Uncharacterized protein n=1 Tax=Araneus ventricosus TaxID=182803 RepID=A0A4Y2JID6_ARAVE|nr:hypothetical protein AVEN_173208-1 [Araneus ventricosus]